MLTVLMIWHTGAKTLMTLQTFRCGILKLVQKQYILRRSNPSNPMNLLAFNRGILETYQSLAIGMVMVLLILQ
jgi:hypothetical protein